MHDALAEGIARVWETRNLRFSQMAALTMFQETNTGTNLPAQIEIEADEGERLELLFIAKYPQIARKLLTLMPLELE